MTQSAVKHKVTHVVGVSRDWIFKSRERDADAPIRRILADRVERLRNQTDAQAVVELGTLALEMELYADQSEAVPQIDQARVFAALYSLALPSTRFDSAGAGQKSVFDMYHSKATLVFSTGKPGAKNYKLHTTWNDESADCRMQMFRLLQDYIPPIESRKHAMYYQICDKITWYRGFCKVAAEIGTPRSLSAIFAAAMQFRAKKYFLSHPAEIQVWESQRQSVPQQWSRIAQYLNDNALYSVISDAVGVQVITYNVLAAGKIDQWIRQAIKDL